MAVRSRGQGAREEAWAGSSWGHAQLSSIFLRSPQRTSNGDLQGNDTDLVLVLPRPSGSEIRLEEARRDGGNEEQLPGCSQNLGEGED